MPRTGRGGSRQGLPGVAHPNRTDLNAPKSLPPTAVPGQTYGTAGAQIQSQQTVPMGVPGLPAQGQPQGQPQAQPMQPGSLGSLIRPTEDPNQPLSHGAPFGAGPNSVPAPMTLGPVQHLAAVLNQLPDSDLPSEVKLLKTQVNASSANQGAY